MSKSLPKHPKANSQINQMGNTLILIAHPNYSFVIILTLTIINLVIQRLLDWKIQFVYAEIGFSILALLSPWIATFLYNQTNSLLAILERIVDLPREEITLWYRAQMNFIFGGLRAYILAALISVAGIMTMTYLGLPWLRSVNLVFTFFWGVFMFVIGIVGWIYIGLLLFLYRFSRLQAKGKPFERLDDEYQDINNTYVKIFIPGVILYLGIIFALWASGVETMAIYNPLGRLWVFPMAVAVVGFFLASQYFIHRSILSSKKSRLNEIDKLLKETYKLWLDDRSVERAKTITELTNWRNNISQEREWALNFQSNLAVVTGLLLPTIKTIVDFFPR